MNSMIGCNEVIAAALEDVSVPALIATVVQLTGDVSFVRSPLRPRAFLQNEFQGKMSDDDKAELRRQALAAIVAWRDAGCPRAEPLEPSVIREIMDWIACESVPNDYAAMYMDEMDLAGVNPRAIRLAANRGAASSSSQCDISVLIIGCGEAGLLAGIRLKEAGISFTIVDKNDDVGGTWLENRYPGCRVDVASHYYSYSFGSDDQFSEYYAQQPELYRYFRGLFDHHDIGAHTYWNREVDRAVWDNESATWQVSMRSPDGTTQTMVANVLISGVGILNRPFVPDIPGLDRFDGPVFHSARWDESFEVSGKRIALVGAGASGFQIGPAVVDDVDQLVVFQRTPQWMAPNLRYHASVKPGEQWAFSNLPGYGRWYRFMLMWQSSDKLLDMVRVDPDWHDFPRTANAFSSERRELFVKWIETNVGDDPELLAKVTPNYPPMSKRMLQDNGSWLQCLKQPHVQLVTDSIISVDENGIVTDKERFDVDAIILATGFRASEVLWPMDIVGRDGVSMADTWEGKPAAYRGVTISGFPNFFVLGGPGTGLAHAGSVILTTECAMRYIGDALRLLIDGNRRTIEPTRDAYARYNAELQAEVATLMWGHGSIEHSWYKAADGKVYVLCPWRLVDYWKMTAEVEIGDHAFT
jgi:4-hydroxyacetophenone monooxygenase